MARINIDTGVLGNASTGDTLRTAMTKINTNFTEVYSLIADGSSGLIATDVTNGDLKLQANGTGVIEIDQLQVSGDAITSIATNGSVDITGNGTGGVNIEALTFNGTSITSSDSSSINLNENVDIDGDLNVTGNITGTFSVSAIGDITAVGSTLTAPSNADLTLTTSGTGSVSVDGIQIKGTELSSSDSTQITIKENLHVTGNITGTIDADNSTVSNLEVDNFKAASIVTEAEGIGSNDNDTTIPTSAAVKDYVDSSEIGTGDLTITGSTISAPSNADITLNPGGTGQVVLNQIKSDDSTHIQVNDGLNVRGGLTVDSGIRVNQIDSGLTATDITITTDPTNSVDINGIQIQGSEISSSDSTQVTIKENLHVTGNITGTITGSIDADSSTVSNLEVDNFKASAIVIESEGIGSNDNDTTIPTSAAVKDYVDNNAGGTTGDLAITGSTISAPSNADLTLNAGGTGSVDIEGIQIKGTEISSTDSTQVTIKENLHVTGNITGTINANQLSGILPAISGELLTGVAKHAFKTIQIGGGNTLVADDPVDTLTINPGNNVTITDDQATDAFTINVNGMGDLTFVGSTIISPSNADITLSPGGTGAVAMPGVTITDNTITSNRSNDNLELNASGTGTVILENLKVGTGGSTVTTILDEDNMATNSATALATQQSIKAYVDSEISGVSAGSTGDLTITGSTISAPSNADLTLTTSGSGTVTASGGFTVTGGDTNTADLVVGGNLSVNFISSDDSTAVTVGDSLNVSGTFSANTIDTNVISSNDSSAIQINDSVNVSGGVVAQGPVTFNAGYIEKVNALTSSSTITVNCATASIHTVTLGTSTEFNITNLPTGGSVTLIITQDGTGSRTATFGTDGSSAVKFPSNSSTLSTGAGDIDVVTIVNDGTNFLGNIAKDYRSS